MNTSSKKLNMISKTNILKIKIKCNSHIILNINKLYEMSINVESITITLLYIVIYN